MRWCCVCSYFILWQCRSPKSNETDSKFIWHTEMNHLCGVTTRWLDTHTATVTRIHIWCECQYHKHGPLHKSFLFIRPHPLTHPKTTFGSGNKWFTIFGSVITIVYFVEWSASDNFTFVCIHWSIDKHWMRNPKCTSEREGGERVIYLYYVCWILFWRSTLECSSMSSRAENGEMELNVTINIVWANGALSIICVFIHFSLLLC